MARIVTAALLALAVLSAGAWWLQRETAAALRDQIALGREQAAELARVRTENERLRATQAPADELARLRADHAAVIRMRQEIETLREGLDERERALATSSGGARPSGSNRSPEQVEKNLRENEAKKQAVEAALAAQLKRKQEKLDREAAGRK